MANLKSSKKDIRRTQKRTIFNDRIRARMKRSVKTLNTLLLEKNIDKAKEALNRTVKVLDKAAQKNVIKKQTASRKISRLNKNLNKIITATNVETAKKGA